MKQSQGLKYLQNLRLGMDELSWLQEEGHEQARHAALGMLMSTGLVVGRTRRGGLDTMWQVHDDDDDGTISVRTGATYTAAVAGQQSRAWAIDPFGYPVVETEAQDILTLPNDGVWYTITMRKQIVTLARGTISLILGNVNVTGVGTEFTRFAGYTTDGFSRGTRILTTLNGTMEIDTVVSDTALTIRTAATANEPNATFEVVGDFYSAVPASPQIQQRYVPLYERIARVRDPATTDAMVLCDAMRNDALAPKVAFIDRRQRNLLRWDPNLEGARGIGLTQVMQADSAWVMGCRSGAIDAVFVGDHDGVTLAPCESGNILGVVSSAGALNAAMYARDSFFWLWLSTAPAFVAAGASQPALVQVPDATGLTHLCFHRDAANNRIVVSTTTDNGTTWNAPVEVWNPSVAGDDVFEPCPILLRNGRLLLLAEYDPNGPGAPRRVRYIYSDDYGTTWSTNGTAGWEIATDAVNTNEQRYPSAAQGPDGLVHVSFMLYDALGLVYSVVYTSSLSPTGLSWPVAADYQVIGVPAVDIGATAIWVGELNIPVVLYQIHAVGHMSISYATGGKDVQGSSSAGAFGGYVTYHPGMDAAVDDFALVQARDGTLMIAFIYDDGGGVDKAEATLLYPVVLDYSHSSVQP